MMIIMGIDPGETTGWAVCEYNTNKASEGLFLQACGQINCEDLLTSGFDVDEPDTKYAGYRAVTLALMQIASEMNVQRIIIEDFTLRQMTTTKAEGISPVRIGAMLCVWIQEIMPVERPMRLIWQTAANAKTVITDNRLKQVQLYQRGLPHANDAIRHCELYRRRMYSE